MPKLKETPWQKRQILLESLIGRYMPMCGIKNKKALAKIAGVSENTIYNWCKNLKGSKIGSVVRVLDVLQVPPEERVGLL